MKCEIAVVGGGVIGLMCAWRLRQSGCNVALFERGEAGREASWAAAGMLAPLCEAARHPPQSLNKAAGAAFLELCRVSRDLYPALAAELLDATGIDIELSIEGAPTSDWRRPGFLYCVTSEADLAGGEFLRLQSEGHAVIQGRIEDAKEIAVTTCFELPHEGQVENRILVRALRAAAIKSGLEIHEGAAVSAILMHGDRLTGIAVGEERIDCNRVLLCAGAWSGTLPGLPPECIPPVRPVRGQMLALRGDYSLAQVVYCSDVYLVPRRDGRILVGATMEETGFDKTTTQTARDQLLGHAYRLLPRLAEFPVEAHWCGLRPSTPDHLPIFGPTPMENLYIAAGHYRNGILLAPATARTMAECILKNAPIAPAFRMERFANHVA